MNEGIRKTDKGYVIDFNHNNVDDIIEIVTPQLYSSSILDNTYWFGYKFKDEVSSKERAEFLKWIKGLSEDKPNERQLIKLIARSLNSLNKVTPLSSIKCVIYPRSQRSELTNKIMGTLGDMLQRGTHYKTYSLIKSLPSSIEFDWDTFDIEYEGEVGDYRYKQIRNYVDNELIPKIHNLDYFSIAANVKPKYRKYLSNYFAFETKEQLDAFNHLQSPNILIVDDINTTGSTLKEILRIINVLNPSSSIFIYTLIGKE